MTASCTYISMLRGVNVGGKKMEMEKLRQIYESMGFKNVRSYIQSGNVLFEYSKMNDLALSQKIEKQILKAFGMEVPVLIRTDREIRSIIEKNPYSKKDPSKLHVTFLRSEPIQDPPLEEIKEVKDSAEEFAILGREVYLFLPKGYGTSKLTNTFFERKLNVSATTRNWRTVNTFVSMMKRAELGLEGVGGRRDSSTAHLQSTC
jgi:uncharacterized protein (DUF1697 family)